jgi:hypothetical protein
MKEESANIHRIRNDGLVVRSALAAFGIYHAGAAS